MLQWIILVHFWCCVHWFVPYFQLAFITLTWMTWRFDTRLNLLAGRLLLRFLLGLLILSLFFFVFRIRTMIIKVIKKLNVYLLPLLGLSPLLYCKSRLFWCCIQFFTQSLHLVIGFFLYQNIFVLVIVIKGLWLFLLLQMIFFIHLRKLIEQLKILLLL